VPAPAVIPALIAYVKVVAVKTLVVGLRSSESRAASLGPLPFGARWVRGEGGRWSSVPLVVLRVTGLGFGQVWLGVPITMIKLG
jgi:hypothetical protein